MSALTALLFFAPLVSAQPTVLDIEGVYISRCLLVGSSDPKNPPKDLASFLRLQLIEQALADVPGARVCVDQAVRLESESPSTPVNQRDRLVVDFGAHPVAVELRIDYRTVLSQLRPKDVAASGDETWIPFSAFEVWVPQETGTSRCSAVFVEAWRSLGAPSFSASLVPTTRSAKNRACRATIESFNLDLRRVAAVVRLAAHIAAGIRHMDKQRYLVQIHGIASDKTEASYKSLKAVRSELARFAANRGRK